MGGGGVDKEEDDDDDDAVPASLPQGRPAHSGGGGVSVGAASTDGWAAVAGSRRISLSRWRRLPSGVMAYTVCPVKAPLGQGGNADLFHFGGLYLFYIDEPLNFQPYFQI